MRNTRLKQCKRFVRTGGKLWCGRRVQFDPEHAAHADNAFRADFAPHQFDQSLAYHQTDAGAFLDAGLLSEAVERLEQLCEFFRGQSFAGIAHTDTYALRGVRAARHFDRSAHAVVFDRVGKQVDENLLYPSAIGIGKVRAIEHRKAHADAAFLCLRFDHGLAIEQHFGQRHGFQRQRQLAGLDQRKIEDFVNQLQQVPSRLENLVDAGLLGGRRQRRTRLY